MDDDATKSNNRAPSEEHIAILRKYFGHSQFRPMQWKIIQSVIEDKCDQCVVMATGYGKSLCYQYPAVYTGGVVIVISPLISLMHDQVLSLEVANIPACYFGSSQQKKSKIIVDGVLNNEYRIVYITPEFCTGDYGSNLLKRFATELNVALIAIDEAHCVSQWGFDFRTSYRKLKVLKEEFPSVPILAVTATATIQVCRDICSSLDLRNPQVIRTDFDRPNLYLGVSLKSKDIFGDIKKFLKRNGLRWTFPGSTIIYCPTKKMAETVSCVLNENSVKCSVYHAELSLKTRQEVHNNFVKDKIQVIAATIAFGMGIDKPDIRLVIHYGAPKDIESYYQEIGRAGRDGLPSTCHVFYSPADFRINQYFLSNLSGKYLEHREKVFKWMEKYLEYNQECRRDLIISYFDPGKKAKKPEGVKFRNNCCDNCTNRLLNKQNSTNSCEETIDQTILRNDVLLLLKAVVVFNGRKGITCPIFLLRGSKSQRLPKEYLNHKYFGAGKSRSEAWWKALGRLLLSEDLIEQRGNNFYGSGNFFNTTTVQVTSHGWNFLRDPENSDIIFKPTKEILTLAKTERLIHFKASKPVVQEPKKLDRSHVTPEQIPIKNNTESKIIKTPMSKEESDLLYEMYYGLMNLRTDLASKFGCMPYMIANNRMLMDLAKSRPKSKEELSKVEGFAQNKVDKFGDDIIEKISQLIEDFNSKQKVESGGDTDNELSEDNSGVQSKSFTDDDKIWGEEDDSFLMTTAYEVIPDFNYDNITSNSEDNLVKDTKHSAVVKSDSDNSLWPDLDLSEIEESFDVSAADKITESVSDCKNDIVSTLNTFSDHKQSSCVDVPDIKVQSHYSSIPFKRKSSLMKFEDSDDSDANVPNIESQSSYRNVSFKRKSSLMKFEDSDDSDDSVKSSLKKKDTSSVVSKKAIPDWINKPDAKKLLIRKMKTNSLFN